MCEGDYDNIIASNQHFLDKWFCPCEDGDIEMVDVVYDLNSEELESVTCAKCKSIYELHNGGWVNRGRRTKRKFVLIGE